ncbi:MAG: imidazole glycerol phosphate synthase subunit HisH [Planctomycetota bacterium]
MIAVLDYEAGNLTSVKLAVRRVGGDPVVTQDPAVVARSERVIFPGVGAAGSSMLHLKRLGLDRALEQAFHAGKPILAVCIGIQLLFDHSEEDGGVDCLGLLRGEAVPFAFPREARVKIPHMGWNGIRLQRAHPVFSGLEEGSEFYFVHSYRVEPSDASVTLAESDYGGISFVSAVGRGSLVAMQFHPEKSGRAGLSLLANFLAWDGRAPA